MTLHEQKVEYAKKLFRAYLKQSDFTKLSITGCLMRAAENANINIFVLAKELDIQYKDDTK